MDTILIPIYEYKCGVCENVFDDFRDVDHRSLPGLCPKCAGVSEKIPSMFSCVTDTNFWYTGKYDPRLESVVEGRQDFKKKIEAKGLHEIGTNDFAVTTTLKDRMKNIPKPI